MAAATPIVIETPTRDIKLLEVRIDPLVDRARAMEIACQEDFERAGDFVRDCKMMEKDIRETLDPAVAQAHKAHKAITKIRADLLSPIEEAERVAKRKMAGFIEEQERAAREAQRRHEAEQRKLEEERRLREAAELEARGHDAAAERVLEQPMTLPAIPQAEAPKAEGISASRRYWAEVTDLQALVRATADGRVPAGLVVADQKVLDAMARAMKDALVLPGVTVRSEPIISAKAR